MKPRLLPTLPTLPTLAILALAAGSAFHANAAVTTWTGGGSDENWSTTDNWSDGLPEANDVVFANADATGAPGAVNNLVDADTTVASLKYTNLDTIGFHTTEIPTGVTLTVNGGGTNIEVQSPTNGADDVVYATILGDGTLTANNPAATLYVGQGVLPTNSTGSTTRRATLDLAGLEEFSATLSRIIVGRQNPSNQPNRAQGTLKLARNNTLILGGTPGILLGEMASNNGSGQAQVLELGVTNTISSNTGMTIGGRKGNGYLRFNSGTVGLGTGSAIFRNNAGTGRQANWLIGDNSTQGGGGLTAVGVANFSLYGEVDALVENIIVGRATAGSATTSAYTQGTLTFDSGVIDTNTLSAGIQPNSPDPGNARGTVNVNGTAQLRVNGDLTLGRDFGSTYNAQGLINIDGGEVTVSGNVICGTGTGNKITVLNGGVLRLGGSLGRPGETDTSLETLEVEDSTLVFNFGAATNPTEARAQVESLLTFGTVDIKATGGNLTPGTIKLIEYTSLTGDGFPAFNLLPTIGITASLVDNSAEGSIDLVITEVASLKWTGTPGGDWDIAGTANWLTVPGNTPSTYQEIDGVGFQTLFDDTASGTRTVNLTTTLSPQSVLVDTDDAYTFTGPGAITGPGALTKQGDGTLTLAGTQAYTGETIVSAGTLEIQGAAVSSSGIVNDAALVFNSASAQSYGNTIAGTGTLDKQGGGTLTLTGTNTFTGDITVSQGVLQIGTGGTAGTLGGNSNTTIATGAELRIERSTDNFGYSYFGELSGSGAVTIPAGRRFNFRVDQPNSGDLSFTLDGTLGINTTDGVTLVEFGALGGSGIIQRAGPAPASPPPTVLKIGGKNTNSTYSGNITSIAEFALEKTGTGTLTLEGTCSHGGTTTVAAGTLALGTAANVPNSNSFSIAAGAMLDTSAKATFAMPAAQPFSFGIDPADTGTSGILTAQDLDITNAVVSLDLADTPDDPVYVLATYTSLTGTAFATEPAVPSGYALQYNYQGDKIALVAGATAGFASWQTVNGTTGGIDDDHDNDGVPNGIEYFLGGPNGNTTGFTALPALDPDTLGITWTKGSGYSGTYGTHFWIETSETLTGTWTEESIPGGNITDAPGSVTYTFPTPLGTKKFARLKVTGP